MHLTVKRMRNSRSEKPVTERFFPSDPTCEWRCNMAFTGVKTPVYPVVRRFEGGV